MVKMVIYCINLYKFACFYFCVNLLLANRLIISINNKCKESIKVHDSRPNFLKLSKLSGAFFPEHISFNRAIWVRPERVLVRLVSVTASHTLSAFVAVRDLGIFSTRSAPLVAILLLRSVLSVGLRRLSAAPPLVLVA